MHKDRTKKMADFGKKLRKNGDKLDKKSVLLGETLRARVKALSKWILKKKIGEIFFEILRKIEKMDFTGCKQRRNCVM